MYYVRKKIEISTAHFLSLSYESKCTQLHGHNWDLTIECKAKELNADGMVVDFTHIKKQILDKLDHKVINDEVDFNPTAENIARWVVETVPNCFRCTVRESAGNEAIFELD